MPPFRSLFCLTTKRTITLDQARVQLKRNDMQFVLIVKTKDGTFGSACKGVPLDLGATMALMTKNCIPLRETIKVAYKALEHVEQLNKKL